MAAERDEETGGTTSYMPPEAFQHSSYTPSFASDIYSYGILLWSVVTGKEPYNMAVSSLVRFCIPRGDRPDLTAVDSSQTPGLSDLIELMKCCWDENPEQRPSFRKCLDVTKKVYELHKKEVHDDICAVQKMLDDKLCSSLKSLRIQTSKTQNGCPKENSHQSLKIEPTPAQVTGGIANSRPKEAEAVARQRVPASSGTSHKPAAKAPPPKQGPPKMQRPLSTPGNVNIHLSNVTGMQLGNNNYMSLLQLPQRRQRQRHPTAPPNVDLPNSRQYQGNKP